MAPFRLPFLFGLLAVVLRFGTVSTESDRCPTFNSCGNCTNQSGCVWCGFESVCKQKNATCSKAVNKNDDDEIYVPNGLNKPLDITLNTSASDLDNNVTYRLVMSTSRVNKTLECSASSQNITCAMNSVLETNESKEVYSAELQYSYQTSDWISLRHKYSKTVTIYNCSKLAELGCNYCKALNCTRYSCAWDNTTNLCIFNEAPSVAGSVTCPPPKIMEVTPKDGPYSGSVTVTLTGREFGVENDTILKDTLKVSGKSCSANIHDIRYDPADPHDFALNVRTGLTCKATGPPQGSETYFSLNGLKSTVDIGFMPLVLKNSTITRVYPDYGPKAGGTRITLFGDNLGIGNRNLGGVVVQGESVMSTSINDTRDGYVIIGEIPIPSNGFAVGNASFSVLLNDVPLQSDKVAFTFMDNPVVQDLKPTHGYLSGGTILTVTGENLNHANRPYIFIRGFEQTETPCELKNSTTAYCKVPTAPTEIQETISPQSRKRATTCDGCQEVEIVVKLDGVEHSFKLKYYHDPSLSKFNNGLQLFNVDQHYLTIEGNNLQLLASTDVKTTIGIEECRMVEITTNSMRCAAPRQQPTPGIPGSEYPEVNVTIGNIKATLGYLKYEVMVEQVALIVGASVGAAMFLSVIVIVVDCIATRKRRANAKASRMLVDKLKREIKDVELQDNIHAQPEEDQPNMNIEHANDNLK